MVNRRETFSASDVTNNADERSQMLTKLKNIAFGARIYYPFNVEAATATCPVCVYLSSSKALTHYYLNQNVKEGIWQAQRL